MTDPIAEAIKEHEAALTNQVNGSPEHSYHSGVLDGLRLLGVAPAEYLYRVTDPKGRQMYSYATGSASYRTYQKLGTARGVAKQKQGKVQRARVVWEDVEDGTK